jgi:hypothetical protein
MKRTLSNHSPARILNVSFINEAFDSQEALFGYSESEEDSLDRSQEKVIYSDVNERSNVSPMPTYVRENNVRYSTRNEADAAGTDFYFKDLIDDPNCPELIQDFSDDDVPLHQEFLVIHDIEVSGGETTIWFCEMRFENGCLVGVNAERNYRLKWGSADLTICGGIYTVSGAPVTQDWQSPI